MSNTEDNMIQHDKKNNNTNRPFSKREIMEYLNTLSTTDNEYNKQQLDSNKPSQSSNDLTVLLTEADYVKPIIDYAMPILLKKFTKDSHLNLSDDSELDKIKWEQNKIYFIPANNKNKDRITEKVTEYSVKGGFSNILDYVRCTISFPTLESLFDFVKFANDFQFAPTDFKDFENAHNLHGFPKAVFGVNNFAIKNIDNTKIEKYDFLKNQVHLKYTEFMDYKLYIKVPMHNNNYMIVEILCTLHEFVKHYIVTHMLYECSRSTIAITNILSIPNDKIISNITTYLKAAIASIHQTEVINTYNTKLPADSLLLDTEQGKHKQYKKDLKVIPSEIKEQLHNGILNNHNNKKYSNQQITLLKTLLTLLNKDNNY